MEVLGYKVFYKGLINRYGDKFEEGITYTIDGEVKWGISGNGFHFCYNLEDCFRYIDTFNYEVDVAFVKGFGNIIEVFDDYYGYYNMYVSEKMEIIKVLTREEIITLMLSKHSSSQLRFLRDFKLTEEELNLFDIKTLKKKTPYFRY